MSVTRRQLRIAIVIGVVVGIVAVPVLGQVLSGFIATSGTIPVSTNTDTTVYVSGASNMSGTDWPFDNTVQIQTDQGNMEVIGNGQANASVDASNIEGTYTNLTALDVGNAVTFDPADKAEITVDGDADELAWTDYAADDGTVDAVVSAPGGQSDITFYGLAADQTYTAVNKSLGTAIDVATANSQGRVTFSIAHSEQTILLQSGDRSTAPDQSNASPTGDLDAEPTDLSVDVDDDDFPDDEVDVTISLDGTQIHSETVASASTVTTSIPASGKTGGEHTWVVNATDSTGNERIESYTYRVPDTLYIRNESNVSELITDPIDVTVQFIAEDTIYERTTDTGTVDLTGLPVSEPLVVDVEASENYTSRTIYFETGEIYEQQAVYLLNNNFSTIDTRFTLNDPTGNYGEQSVLTISRAINDSGNLTYATIHADKFGVEGVTATLQSDTRYKISIKNADGSLQQDLGPYRSDVTENVEIQPSAPGVTFDSDYDNWGYGVNLDNDTLTWSYYDNEDLTDSLTIWIHERGNPDNNLQANETYLNLGNVSGQVILTANETETEWVVKFFVDRDGEEGVYSTDATDTEEIFPGNLDDGWKAVVSIGLLLLLGGSLSVLNVGVGAVVFGVAGGVLWYLGWLAGITTGAAIAAYMVVAIMVYIMKGGRL